MRTILSCAALVLAASCGGGTEPTPTLQPTPVVATYSSPLTSNLSGSQTIFFSPSGEVPPYTYTLVLDNTGTPTYSSNATLYTWDTKIATNGAHTWTLIAKDSKDSMFVNIVYTRAFLHGSSQQTITYTYTGTMSVTGTKMKTADATAYVLRLDSPTAVSQAYFVAWDQLVAANSPAQHPGGNLGNALTNGQNYFVGPMVGFKVHTCAAKGISSATISVRLEQVYKDNTQYAFASPPMAITKTCL
jgi:hypothetical protein